MGKKCGQFSWRLALSFSAPVFQLRSNFSSAETTEMSGKCVVALATGKEVGAGGNKKGAGDGTLMRLSRLSACFQLWL